MNDKRLAKELDKVLQQPQPDLQSQPNEIRQLCKTVEMLLNAPQVELYLNNQRLQKTKLLNGLPPRNTAVTKFKARRFNLRKQFGTPHRRFAMTWILIVAAFLSLFGGVGAVYASDSAVPGDILYPVKTLVEDSRLLLADNESDVNLLLEFLDERLEEIGTLLDVDDPENLLTAINGYENRAQQLEQLRMRIQTENPLVGDAQKIMMELRFQEQAELMEGYANSAGDMLQIRERLQQLQEINNQLRLREKDQKNAVHQSEELDINKGEKAGQVQEQPDDKGQGQGNKSGTEDQATQWNASLEAYSLTTDGQFVLTFRVHSGMKGNLYMKVNGVRYDCGSSNASQGVIECRSPEPNSENVQVELFDANTNEVLYSSYLRMNHSGQEKGKNQSDSEQGNKGSGKK